jgi:integrase
MTVTASQLKSFYGKERTTVIEKADRDNLSIRLSKRGKVSFYLRFQFNGKQQRFCIGVYPNMSLADAREEIGKLNIDLSKGIDPRLSSRQENQYTLDDCLNEWIEKRVEKQLRPKTIENYRSTIKHFEGKFKYCDVESIKGYEWLAFFDQISVKSPVLAGSLLRTVKAALRWCIRRQLIPDNLSIMKFNLSDIGARPSKKGDRVLTIDEVKSVLRDTEKSGAKANMRAAITCTFIMACRIGELNTMQWDHLFGDNDEMIWTVPAELSKTNEKIRRPVPKLVRDKIELMGELYGKSGFVFSSDKLSRGISITAQAVDRQLKRCAKRLIDKQKVSGVFRAHDSRRTLVTNLADVGIAMHVLEKMLGHKLIGVMSHYQKSDWISEQRKAYELWSSMIFDY